MTVSRVLPATLAPRFRQASRAILKAESASLEVVAAERFLLRLRGLAGLDAAAIVPLLLPHCRSLHTFGMRAPIDVVWLELGPDGEGEILAVEQSVPSRRIVRAPRGTPRQRVAALELVKDDATELALSPGTTVRLANATHASSPE